MSKHSRLIQRQAWNRGKLAGAKTFLTVYLTQTIIIGAYYSGANSGRQAAAELTGYKWSFASKKSSAEDAAIGAARRAVEAATTKSGDADEYMPAASSSTGARKPIGPTLPSRDDLVLAREAEEEKRAAERAYKRLRERAEDKTRVEDLVGPKEVGREGMLEKKRVKRDGDRSFRDAKDDSFAEVDESTLMGGGDSFKAR